MSATTWLNEPVSGDSILRSRFIQLLDQDAVANGLGIGQHRIQNIPGGNHASRGKFASLAIGLPVLALAGVADAQQQAGGTDAEYTARVMTAAPPQIVQDATIVRTVNGAMQTLKKGTNEFTCMEVNDTPMCMGPNAMEWIHA